jgi:hypothetical protein
MELEENGKRIETLRRMLEEVAVLYTHTREDGIVSVRFLNARRGRKNVKIPSIDTMVSNIAFRGVTRIGSELKRKVLDAFLFGRLASAERKRPLLVMVITDGQV